MKKLFWLSILITASSAAQINTGLNKNDISEIVNQFSLANCNVKTLYVDSVSYKKYYNDTLSNIKIIEVKTVENSLQKQVKWYYYQNKYVYCAKIWQNAVTLNMVEKEEFFINDTTLLLWTINDKPTDFNSNSNQELAINLIRYGKNLLETINR